MERLQQGPAEGLIELGSVSGDTEGNFSAVWEPMGYNRSTGISDE